MVALAIANLLHEGMGRGGLTDGHARVLSSVHFECDPDRRFIAPGGALVNFIAGLLCWFRAANPKRQLLRYFLWLLGY